MWRNKFEYRCLPRTNGSPRILHSSVKIGMHCFFAYYSISTSGSMISKTSKSGRCSMRAWGSWSRTFGCGCGWATSATSSHHLTGLLGAAQWYLKNGLHLQPLRASLNSRFEVRPAQNVFFSRNLTFRPNFVLQNARFLTFYMVKNA